MNLTVKSLAAATCSTAVVLAVALAGCTSKLSGGDWNTWVGPHRDFTTRASGLADAWPDEGPPKVWRRDLGEGYSSIVGNGETLYTMYRDGDKEVAIALDAKTGATKWEYRYATELYKGQAPDFGTGPNATPLLMGDRVITVGFTGKLHCLSADRGQLLWSHDLVKDFKGKIQKFGYWSSPIAYRGAVIVQVGGDEAGLVAFYSNSGRVAWKSKPLDISYATPQIINVDGQDQLVFFSSTEVMGMNPYNGTLLWRHPCENQYKNNATPVLWGKDNLLWVATQLDGGTRALRLTQSGGRTNVEEVWFNNKVKVFHWNAVRVGDHVYASIGGQTTFLAAVDINTGEIKWRERGFHKALVLYADNKLYFVDENGQLVMARVSPEKCEILAQTSLLEKVAWTTPTLIGKTLYVRDKKQIMALDLSAS